MKAFLVMCLLVCSQAAWSQDTVAVGDSGTTKTVTDSSKPNEKDSLIEFLKKLDLDKFDKRTTGDFLKVLPFRYKLRIQPANREGYVYRSFISHPERPYLEIYLYYRGFQFTNPNSFFKKKQQRQVKKERMSEINIYNEFLCINGCD